MQIEPMMMKRQPKRCHVQMLPEDLLADVLRRLPPRSIAVSRCVCKARHAIVDDHKLLRADLLPLSFGGIMVNFNELVRTDFLSYRGPGCAAVSGDLGYLPHPNNPVQGHCNGLLLLHQTVANPATRQWSRLPRQPAPRMRLVGTDEDFIYYEEQYLVYDPAISPDYEVFLMPVVHPFAELDRSMAESEWPPLLCETHVFSSRTGRWEKRSFVREGDPAGTTVVIQQAQHTVNRRYSVYWREALYIHSPNDFFCRISLTDNKYQIIKPPVTSTNLDKGPHKAHLGKSENGVYCAILDLEFRIRVWIIEESSGQMEWVLKHENNLAQVLKNPDFYEKADGDWTFEDINRHAFWPEYEDDAEEHVHQSELKEHRYVTLLGFHPFKETVFLNSTLSRGFAYGLNSSKVQDLGNMCLTGYYLFHDPYIKSSFPYTPCWMDIPKRKLKKTRRSRVVRQAHQKTRSSGIVIIRNRPLQAHHQF